MAVTSQNKEKFEDYDGFVEKFKPKKTTDDCYTPDTVIKALNKWVAEEYKLNQDDFIRPFYPGGDYESENYSGKIVVDNPPFSILAKIIQFYVNKEIKFFLFAPTLTCCRYGDYCTVLPVGADIRYENGAEICTSFVTNLEPHEIRARTAPTLYNAINEANKNNIAMLKKSLPKYSYPLDLVTTSAIYPYAKYGIDFVIPRDKSIRVLALDHQKECKKAIYGGGWLISEEVKAEREKAEREKAVCWMLSEREKAIIDRLNKYHNN